MTANTGYCRPTNTNTYQWKPTAANTSQQMVTRTGPTDATCHLDPGMFLFFFIHSFTIDILYISVNWANAGQQMSMIAFIMQANEDQQKPTVAITGWQPPTAIIFTHHHLVQLHCHPIQPITPSLCSTTTTLFNHTTSSFNHKLQSFSFDIGFIILSLSSN